MPLDIIRTELKRKSFGTGCVEIDYLIKPGEVSVEQQDKFLEGLAARHFTYSSAGKLSTPRLNLKLCTVNDGVRHVEVEFPHYSDAAKFKRLVPKECKTAFAHGGLAATHSLPDATTLIHGGDPTKRRRPHDD